MRGLGKCFYVEEYPKVAWSLWSSTSGQFRITAGQGFEQLQ